MPTQPFEVPFPLTLVMLTIMFASIILSMYFWACFIPKLTTDTHDKTSWLDGLRGGAAAIVALNHVPMVLINLDLVPKVFYFPVNQHTLFHFFGSIGVQIFFCITGMLFANKILFASEVDWTSFFKQRLLRLLPAYVLAATLAIFVALLLTRFSTLNIMEVFSSLPNIFAFGLLPLPNINGFDLNRLIGVNWSLAYEWRYYVMLPICFVMIRNLPLILIAFVIIIFATCDVMFTGNSVWIYFVSGAVCAPLMNKKLSKRMNNLGSALTLVLLVIYVITWSKFSDYGPQRWGLMTAFFLSMVMSRPYVLTLKPFVVMGSASYSFYLLHAMIVFVVIGMFHKLVMDVTLLTFSAFIILACLALAAATLISAVSYLNVERPFMRLRDKVR
jgi:peptidoglycan/LPS O-acetylase OafA/YrhL